jgi:uncharacterized protein YndB with AHSA1/START domain
VPSIERTLVKSPPELWELVDDQELMERWSAELLGAAGRVRVVERERGERLVWEVPADGDPARIELVLAEKGWGTTVSIRVAGPGARSDDAADSHLEQLLDELGSPQRQPFTRT